MFARFFDIQDTINSYDDNYREFISSVFINSFSIRSAEFKQISQVQGKCLIMFSLSVK